MIVPHRQRLELAVDVLKGCDNVCAGCMVNLDTVGVLSDMGAILKLAQEFVGAGFSPYDFTIGATDILTATNTAEVMCDPNIKALIDLFDSFTLNAAFLDKRVESYETLANMVDACAPGKPVRFLIPAAPGSFKNPKFGAGIAQRLGWVNRYLKEATLSEAGFVVNCTRETLSNNGFDNLIAGFGLEFPVRKDDILNIPYGRTGKTDLQTSESIKLVSHEISKFYKTFDGSTERTSNPDICSYTGTHLNLTYSEGELYWVPFLKDECTFLHDNFKVPKPWSMQNVLQSRGDTMASSLDYVLLGECGECQHLSTCVEKGITVIMDTLSIKQCLVGL